MKRELTKREKEILKLSGYTREQIADKLCISKATVMSHLDNIREKLNVKSKEQSLIVALKHHLIDVQEVDCGFWNSDGVYIEDPQIVEWRKI